MTHLFRLAAVAVCAAAAASAAHAQQRVQSVPSASAPSASQRSAQSAPNPAGLRSTFPAGITSGSGASVSPNPIAQSTAVIPPSGTGVTAGPGLDNTLPDNSGNNNNGNNPNNTSVLGAGATVRGPGQRIGGAGGFSATDIARSFFFADANKDGELTRAEASRLSIQSMSFEEMDRNFDGIITRFEYDDATR
jgi:opacity protein-like surface antigen